MTFTRRRLIAQDVLGLFLLLDYVFSEPEYGNSPAHEMIKELQRTRESVQV